MFWRSMKIQAYNVIIKFFRSAMSKDKINAPMDNPSDQEVDIEELKAISGGSAIDRDHTGLANTERIAKSIYSKVYGFEKK